MLNTDACIDFFDINQCSKGFVVLLHGFQHLSSNSLLLEQQPELT
ncbi:MAG: hypothetical protein QX195_09620 [Methylococcaceae bacterium]